MKNWRKYFPVVIIVTFVSFVFLYSVLQTELSSSIRRIIETPVQFLSQGWQGSGQSSIWERLCRETRAGRMGFMIPDDDILQQASALDLMNTYWKYINTLQVLCTNQTRLGGLSDGGKEICIDEDFLLNRPCLVYSFGSNFQFDFEVQIITKYGCEIHTFDPSKSTISKVLPYDLHFHLKGLAEKDYTNDKGWTMRSMSTIVKELGHEGRIIDLLKIDIEGGEWDGIPEMFQSGFLKKVRQISMEIHFDEKMDENSNAKKIHQLKCLKQLYEAGFRLFMHEHNLNSAKRFEDPVGMITFCNEISLVNVLFNEITGS